MGRRPCCDKKEGLNRGAWTSMEDKLLTDHINLHGEGQWRSLPKVAGLKRCGKSCRLRWLNYLRPEIKRGNITADEDDLIIRLHSLLGNRWSLIAGRLPGRTDNEIKNYWNTNLSKKIIQDDRRNLRNNEKTKLNHQRKLPQPKTTDSGSVVVVRTKAVKCTRVFLTPPHPPLPPPPPPSTQMQNPASKGFEIGDSFSLEEGLMLDDPFLMDFGVSFSEFLDSDKLMSVMSSDVSFAELNQDTGDQLSSPEDPVGVFPEGMIGDWRGSGGALDGSMLENWLGV